MTGYVSLRVEGKHAGRDRYLDECFSRCPKCKKFDLVSLKKGNKIYDFCGNCEYKGKEKEEKI